MAIQVNGTTVINDSRNLANVGGLKTVNGTSILGSGNIEAGASTTYGAVGTYVLASSLSTSQTQYNKGSTYAGSGLYPAGFSIGDAASGLNYAQYYTQYYSMYVGGGTDAGTLSGTWRAMGQTMGTVYSTAEMPVTLFVRIS